MSGIYIPNMRKPTRCRDCPFVMIEDVNWCGRCNYNICDGLVDLNEVPEWCDLIPVPDHGRLIDADALPRFGGRKGLIHASDVDAAPTIILADKGVGE